MQHEWALAAFAASLGALLAALVAAWLVLGLSARLERLRLLAEQALAGGRGEGETTRGRLAAVERDLGARLDQGRLDLQDRLATSGAALVAGQAEARVLLEGKLREMAEANAAALGELRRTVHEQLHEAVEKQMQSSFQRVIEQFAAVQKAMGDVQAVTAQIGDLKRVFSNVKSRGGWGETQLAALLDDALPAGSYERDVRLATEEGSGEVVEFAVRMPMRGGERPLMAIDAKLPTEAYERLLDAAATGDAPAERQARLALEAQIRAEARKIAAKYIRPPVTVDFAVLYLPSDGLFAEVARAPGLLDQVSRESRVQIMGPSLLPALLRTIHLGYISLSLEQNSQAIGQLLGATRAEMLKMDDVLEKLGKNAGTMSRTIEEARRRTRAVGRKLRGIAEPGPEVATALLGEADTLEEEAE